jgi:protoporphyrinogen oxidase
MHVVVVGGGLLGLSTAYYLARDGHRVTVCESGTQLGGLATDVDVDGIQVDRFYHCILSADQHLIDLIDQVGLRDQLRMRPVRAGFFASGKTYSISTPLDMLRFPPLRPSDRLRLVRSLLACRRVKDWHALEEIDVESWLRKLSGGRVFDAVWRPLLSAKFDGNFAQTPATYIWSRTVRMTDTRSAGGQRELAGHLVGGYRVLADRLAQVITELGGQVRVDYPVDALRTAGGRVVGVRSGAEWLDCDAAVLTLPLPLSARLLRSRVEVSDTPAETVHAIDAYAAQVEAIQGYLGVVCVLLMLRRPLSSYYTLYLAEKNLPFTAVIETTNLIDPALVGGRHLVYLPKYVDPDSEIFHISENAIRAWFVDKLRTIYPDFRDDDIIAAPVFKARHVEPLHPLGSFGTVPPIETPLDGLWLGSTKHFYPRLNNGDAVTRLGAQLAAAVARDAPATTPGEAVGSPHLVPA